MFEVFPLCRQDFVAPCVVQFQCSTSNIKGDTATFYFLHLTSHFDHVIVYFTHCSLSWTLCSQFWHFSKLHKLWPSTVIFSNFHPHDHVAVMFEVFPLCRQDFVAPCVVQFQCSTSNIKGDTATFYFLHLTSHFDHVIVYFTHCSLSWTLCSQFWHFSKLHKLWPSTVIFSNFHPHDHVAVMFEVFPLCRQDFVAPCVVKFQCSTSNIKGDTATFYFLHLTRHFDHVIVYFNIVACLGRSAANSDNFNDARTMTVDRYFFILSPSWPCCSHVWSFSTLSSGSCGPLCCEISMLYEQY